MGYYGKQMKDLADTIRKSKAEIVVSGTPINLTELLKVDIPVLHVDFSITEREGNLEAAISKLLAKK